MNHDEEPQALRAGVPGETSVLPLTNLRAFFRVPRVRAFVDLMLPGLYAWGVTVAAPAASRHAPLPARVFALLAPLLLGLGGWLTGPRLRLARSLAIAGFCAACLSSWVAMAPLLLPGRLDPFQATLGSLGWALFAVGWGGSSRILESVREPGEQGLDQPGRSIPLPPPDESALAPRARLARGAVFVVVFGISSALVVLALAFRIDETERGLFAHGVALASAVAIAGASAVVATERGKARAVRPGVSRIQSIRGTLLFLFVLFLAALLRLFLR